MEIVVQLNVVVDATHPAHGARHRQRVQIAETDVVLRARTTLRLLLVPHVVMDVALHARITQRLLLVPHVVMDVALHARTTQHLLHVLHVEVAVARIVQANVLQSAKVILNNHVVHVHKAVFPVAHIYVIDLVKSFVVEIVSLHVILVIVCA